MKFSTNPSKDVSLRNDMVARELTGTGYEAVPEEIRRIAPIEKAREYAKQAPQASQAVPEQPTLDFIEEPEAMQTKPEQAANPANFPVSKLACHLVHATSRAKADS